METETNNFFKLMDMERKHSIVQWPKQNNNNKFHNLNLTSWNCFMSVWVHNLVLTLRFQFWNKKWSNCFFPTFGMKSWSHQAASTFSWPCWCWTTCDDPAMYETLWKTGNFPCQLVQEFFHQQYVFCPWVFVMTASTAICNLLFASPSFLEELFWEELKISKHWETGFGRLKIHWKRKEILYVTKCNQSRPSRKIECRI